jgi:hypothetical protein
VKKKHEEICKAEFDTLVRTIFPQSQITWDDVKNDPPDWFLSIDNSRYAVEATSIVELSDSMGIQLSSIDVITSLHKFIKSVEKSAIEEGILNGTYVVTLCPIPNFGRIRKKLHNDLIDYVRETRDLSKAKEHILRYVRHQRISIKKEHSDKSSIGEAVSFGAKWEGDAQKELEQFVMQALTKKVEKLNKVNDPIILLLLDAFHYSFMADWVSAINLCKNRIKFHTICRIVPNKPSDILWSRSSNWKPSARR